jgi:hypothetical protein
MFECHGDAPCLTNTRQLLQETTAVEMMNSQQAMIGGGARLHAPTTTPVISNIDVPMLGPHHLAYR